MLREIRPKLPSLAFRASPDLAPIQRVFSPALSSAPRVIRLVSAPRPSLGSQPTPYLDPKGPSFLPS